MLLVNLSPWVFQSQRKDTKIVPSRDGEGNPCSRKLMLAKGPRGVNGKCVLVCTKLENQWSKVADLTCGHFPVGHLDFDNVLIMWVLMIGRSASRTCIEIAYWYK